ncbi:MAG: hypothetical protein EON47_04250 [Acetobacteraceae bacterium]|nr:MAG: hypothetical protein EON47_04250 [Acetobacteraceae bacterium]
MQIAAAWDARVAHLLTRLPLRVQSGVAWLRHPSRKAWRLLAGVLLILGGMLAILPILGLWMLPLGLALLSDDFPWLKVWLEKSARGIGRLWRRVRRRDA